MPRAARTPAVPLDPMVEGAAPFPPVELAPLAPPPAADVVLVMPNTNQVLPAAAACEHPEDRVESYPSHRPVPGGAPAIPVLVTRCIDCGASRVVETLEV